MVPKVTGLSGTTPVRTKIVTGHWRVPFIAGRLLEVPFAPVS
jgi:hypothetical protein